MFVQTIQQNCEKNFVTQNYLKLARVQKKTAKLMGRLFLNQGEVTLENCMLHN